MKITSRLILAEDKAKKGFQQVTLKLVLPVGEAKNNTVLGPLLGQHQINIMSFCNEFNNKSVVDFMTGIPVPVFVNLKKDKTYLLNIRYPTLSFFFSQIINKEQVFEGLEKKVISIEKLYDVIKIYSHFLSKNEKEVMFLVFGYLSSFKNKIIIKC